MRFMFIGNLFLHVKIRFFFLSGLEEALSILFTLRSIMPTHSLVHKFCRKLSLEVLTRRLHFFIHTTRIVTPWSMILWNHLDRWLIKWSFRFSSLQFLNVETSIKHLTVHAA